MEELIAHPMISSVARYSSYIVMSCVMHDLMCYYGVIVFLLHDC